MNKIKLIITIFLCVFFSVYTIMLSSTTKLINEVKSVMAGEVDTEITKGRPISRYNNSDIYKNAIVDVSVKRLFTVHNFSNGYI